MSQKRKKDSVHKRTKYTGHSNNFYNWASELASRQTIFGRLIYYLFKRFDFKKLGIIFLFCVSLAFIMFYEFDLNYQPRLGEVAQSDVKSSISFEMIDEATTATKQKEVEESIPLVFDENADVYDRVYHRLYKSFRQMRSLYRKKIQGKSRKVRYNQIKNFLVNKHLFEKALEVEVSTRNFEWLIEKKFSVRTENLVKEILEFWSIFKSYDGSGRTLKKSDLRAVIRDRRYPDDEHTVDARELVDVRRKKSLFTLPATKSFLRKARRLTKVDRSLLLRFSHSLLVPKVIYNIEETEKRIKKAQSLVPPVKISIEKNQTIVSAGSVVQASHIILFKEIESRSSGGQIVAKTLAIASILFLLTLVLFSYLRRFTVNKVRVCSKDLLIMGSVTLICMSVIKIFIFFINSVTVLKFGNNIIPSEAAIFISPIAAAAMCVGLLISMGELVWIFILFISVALAVMLDANLSIFIISVLSGVAGARGVFKCEKRNHIYLAGLRTGGITALAVFIMSSFSSLEAGNWLNTIAWNVPAAFIGGVFSSMVTLSLVPILESLFNCTTDLKLLELSNLNHELIKSMMVKSPGTYHHSLAVGNMVEEAADRIEANALLAKVMAYYHDIGKTEHAEYFIENQRPGYNPHDNITPYMSKTIIIAHVKDGAELGIKNKLGKSIIDGILQHHGTTLINYFYNKALAIREDREEVNEEEFRYPGPKPQFKEAALVMLADSIEAAARSISEPTSSKLTSLVEDIIDDKVLDGQLAECNLDFRELYIIRETYTKTLLSIYHHRIDYAKAKNEQSITEKKSQPSNERKKT